MAADERIATLIVSLDPGDSVAKANALRQALAGVAEGGEKVAVTQEKVTRAFAAGSADKWIASMNAGEGAAMKLANGLDKLRRLEEQGEVTERQRGVILDSLTGKYMTAVQAIERKAEAEKKAAQTAKEAAEAEKRGHLEAIAAIDKHFGAELKLQDKLKDAAAARQAGHASLAQEVALREKAQLAYRNEINALDVQEAAMRKSATATGLARHELINFSRQAQDVVVSLSGGQSFFRVLIEQGSQMLDILASSKASIAQFGSQIASWGRSLGVGALIVGIGTLVTAMVTGAAAAALSWGSARSDVEKALLGIGRASGATVDSIEKIAESSSSMFGLSISEAREFASILASTGKIGSENLAGLTALGKNLAITLGTDSTGAAKELGKALSGSSGAIEGLNDKLGAFDAATLRRMNNLISQNRLMEMQAIAMEGIKKATENAAQAASSSQNFWTGLLNVMSDTWTFIGKIAARSTGIGLKVGVDEAVETARKNLEAARQNQNIGAMPGTEGGSDPEVIRKLEEAWKAAVEAQRKYNAEVQNTKENLRSIADAKIVRDLSPEIEQFEQLNNRAEHLNRVMEEIQRSGGAQESPVLAAMGQTMEQVARSAARAKEALSSALTPAARLTAEFELAKQAITARTAAERQALAAQQTILSLAGQNVSAAEKKLAVERAVALEIAKQAQQHKDNMTALEGQLAVAKARPGLAQQVAQEEATIVSLLREGYTLMQAQEQAAMQRAIAVAQANQAIDQQIIALRQGVEMERARLEGTEAATAAAHAYANAMRSGASQTKAAALAAATLEANLERAEIAAEQAARSMAAMSLSATKAAAEGGNLGAKLELIGTGQRPGSSFSAGTYVDQFTTPIIHHAGSGGGPLVGSAGASTAYNISNIGVFAAQLEASKAAGEKAAAAQAEAAQKAADAARAAQDAARAQQDAARAAQDAAIAQAEAAKAAREAFISQLDEQAPETIASLLLQGMSANDVNTRIEQGGLVFGTANARFEAQLDLYKRAGASNSQIAGDIRAGIIGEGASPSKLLAALDSLTDAVTGNTDALIGLSPFYTSQGDRQLGYRGYTVQKGATNIPGAGIPIGGDGGGGGIPTGGTGGTGGTGATGGTGGTGGGYSPGSGGGITGGVANPGGSVSYDSGAGQYVWNRTPIAGGATEHVLYYNGQPVRDPDGDRQGYVTFSDGRKIYAGGTKNDYSNAFGYGFYRTMYRTDGSIYMSESVPLYRRSGTGILDATKYYSYQEHFADGGMVDRPTNALIGEAGPEAVIPLKNGNVPVKLIDRMPEQNRVPTTVVNINAPLVNFAVEPSRDEVRESAFQAGQMLRRQMVG